MCCNDRLKRQSKTDTKVSLFAFIPLPRNPCSCGPSSLILYDPFPVSSLGEIAPIFPAKLQMSWELRLLFGRQNKEIPCKQLVFRELTAETCALVTGRTSTL